MTYEGLLEENHRLQEKVKILESLLRRQVCRKCEAPLAPPSSEYVTFQKDEGFPPLNVASIQAERCLSAARKSETHKSENKNVLADNQGQLQHVKSQLTFQTLPAQRNCNSSDNEFGSSQSSSTSTNGKSINHHTLTQQMQICSNESSLISQNSFYDTNKIKLFELQLQ